MLSTHQRSWSLAILFTVMVSVSRSVPLPLTDTEWCADLKKKSSEYAVAFEALETMVTARKASNDTIPDVPARLGAVSDAACEREEDRKQILDHVETVVKYMEENSAKFAGDFESFKALSKTISELLRALEAANPRIIDLKEAMGSYRDEFNSLFGKLSALGKAFSAGLSKPDISITTQLDTNDDLNNAQVQQKYKEHAEKLAEYLMANELAIKSLLSDRSASDTNMNDAGVSLAKTKTSLKAMLDRMTMRQRIRREEEAPEQDTPSVTVEQFTASSVTSTTKRSTTTNSSNSHFLGNNMNTIILLISSLTIFWAQS